MRTRIFLSYRRDDSKDVAGRIHDRLAEAFGRENVFFDVDSIPFGIDFREEIRKSIRQVHMLVVLIGTKFDFGRLAQRNDYVRIELLEAIKQDKLVIPALVNGAQMPMQNQLPPSLRMLAFRNAVAIRSDPDFHRDVTRLIEGINLRLTQHADVDGLVNAPKLQNSSFDQLRSGDSPKTENAEPVTERFEHFREATGSGSEQPDRSVEPTSRSTHEHRGPRKMSNEEFEAFRAEAARIAGSLPKNLRSNLSAYSQWLWQHDFLPPSDHFAGRPTRFPNWTKQAKPEWIELLVSHGVLESPDIDTEFTDIGIALLWTL